MLCRKLARIPRQPPARTRSLRSMKQVLLGLLVILVLVVVGGFAFLATWSIPAPTQPMEKTIPNDRLFH